MTDLRKIDASVSHHRAENCVNRIDRPGSNLDGRGMYSQQPASGNARPGVAATVIESPARSDRTDLCATMIVLTYGYAGESLGKGWQATLHWQDGRWCESGTVQGVISTRYFEKTPADAINHVLAVAETFRLPLVAPDRFHLLYRGIAESIGDAPTGHRALMIEESAKRGWNCPYKAEVQP